MNTNNFKVRKSCLSADVQHGFSVLYMSDFHFNARSQPVAEWMLAQITALQPDLVLLGGDYADSTRGRQVLEIFLERLPTPDRCFAIAGNHDYFHGVGRLRALFDRYGIHWVEKRSVTLRVGAVSVRIDGNHKYFSDDTSYFSILCAHRPRVLNGNLKDYRLAFAGHLHGSQVVLWQKGQALYPGRFFYAWNVLSKIVDDCSCYISKGLGDTLPLRYNCKKDIIFVEVVPRNIQHFLVEHHLLTPPS